MPARRLAGARAWPFLLGSAELSWAGLGSAAARRRVNTADAPVGGPRVCGYLLIHICTRWVRRHVSIYLSLRDGRYIDRYLLLRLQHDVGCARHVLYICL